MTPKQPADDEFLAAALHASRRLQEAPEAAIQRAIYLFAAQPAARAAPVAAPGLLRRLVATLTQDSSTLTPQAAGLRSVTHDTRQLLYSAEGCDVDLRLAAAADGLHFVISGQLLGPEAAGNCVLATAGGEQVVAWNDLCEFQFQPVAPGRCVLTLRAGDWQLELPAFDAGA